MPLSAAPSASAEGATGHGVAGVSCGRRQVRRWSGRFAEHTVSRRQRGAGHRGSSDSRRLCRCAAVATPSRLGGTRSRAAAQARSRGSSQGFARAADCGPRVLAAVVQLHDGDIVARVSRQQTRASRVAWSRRRARASVRGGHHRVGACSNAGGTIASWQTWFGYGDEAWIRGAGRVGGDVDPVGSEDRMSGLGETMCRGAPATGSGQARARS